MVAAGFSVALVAELASWAHKPERIWYEGRALAESVKTLAWRYAVCAEPFTFELDSLRVREDMRRRVEELLKAVGGNVSTESAHPIVTPKMESIRNSSFGTRKEVYIAYRTKDQLSWYLKKAKANRQSALLWRISLLIIEVIAVVFAVLGIFFDWQLIYIGILGTVIACGAAWVALKQYEPLASAYFTAARELSIQTDALSQVPDSEWSSTVADAEDAISREHTLWLASRGSNIFL